MLQYGRLTKEGYTRSVTLAPYPAIRSRASRSPADLVPVPLAPSPSIWSRASRSPADLVPVPLANFPLVRS